MQTITQWMLQKWSFNGIFAGFLIIIAGMGLLIGLQYISILGLKIDKATIEGNLKQANEKVIAKDALILSNKVDYEKKLEKVLKDNKTITQKYIKAHKDVDNFKGDSNETDCVNAKLFLDHFNY